MVLKYIEVDTVSGRKRYYDTTTNSYVLGEAVNDTTPTKIIVTYDAKSNTYGLKNQNNENIPGAQLINSATDAVSRAEALGDVVDKSQVQSRLDSEQSTRAKKTAESTATPPPANTGNAVEADYKTPETKKMESTVSPTDKDLAKSGTAEKDITKVVGESIKVITGPFANPLSAFPSYTYGVALWMLTPEDYNKLHADPLTWNPGKNSGIISASGGKYSTSGSYPRLSEFGLDVFIDDLKIDTVTPTALKGKGSTNMLSGSFTIIEPLGMTFVDNLAKAVHRISKSSDGRAGTYTQIPYMLEIDFYGANEDYIIQSKSLYNGAMKKRFSVIWTNMTVSFTNRGTEYKVTFAPYAHAGFDEDRLKKDAPIVNAKTVGEFFSGKGSATLEYYGTVDEKGNITPRTDLVSDSGYVNYNRISYEIATANATRKLEDKENQTNIENKKATDNAGKNADENPSSGLAYHMNNYYNSLVTIEKARRVPDFVKFVFHPDIAKSTIVNDKEFNINSIPMSVRAITDPSLLSDNKALTFDGASYNISAGTSVMELIGKVLRNSSYIQRQLKTPETPNTKTPESADKNASNSPAGSDSKSELYETQFKWFKVVPKVELGDWDEKAGRYARKTTYYVMPYIVHNTQHPLAPQTVPQGKPFKEYNYFFTGKNTEIIDCKIEFNTAFTQLVMVGNNNKLLESTPSSNDTPEVTKGSYPGLNGVSQDPSGEKFESVPTVQPRQVEHIVNHQPDTSNLGGNKNQKTQIAASVIGSLTAQASGSMLTLKVRIVGDPHYIKQDEFLWNPGSTGWVDPILNPDRYLLKTGSLPYNMGEMYVDFMFKSPEDIDLGTGLVTPSLNSTKSNMFSGRFRVLRCENLFSKGKFEQTIDLVRYPDQEVVPAVKKANDAARPGQTQSSPTPTAKATATVASGPSNEQESIDAVYKNG